MHSVTLVIPSFNVPKFKGLAKVSKKLYEGLKKEMEVDVIEVHKKGKQYWKTITTVPIQEAFSKTRIIHALTPELSSFLPLMKWKASIVTWHDFIPLEESKRLHFKFRRLIRIYLNVMWKLASKCDVIIANSSQTAEQIREYYGRDEDVYVINPGVDERFVPKDVKKDKPTLGFFANFSFRKQVDKAIEVFKIVKKHIDCRLILAGGKLQTIYQRQFDVKKLVYGLKDVEIKGYIPENMVVRLYNSFDVFLFPSTYEGFGLPILEAQACGVPVFIFKDAKIPEETRRFAIECEDVKDMAEKVINLLENEEEYLWYRKKGIEYA
ncbi:glycosyltransferase family 4 protein, partial [Candidatus Bathyarchaeota archaeon]|nr:glycosyltransferase family 4 protein [Candidatus Bathyarchaeota archaeon]